MEYGAGDNGKQRGARLFSRLEVRAGSASPPDEAEETWFASQRPVVEAIESGLRPGEGGMALASTTRRCKTIGCRALQKSSDMPAPGLPLDTPMPSSPMSPTESPSLFNLTSRARSLSPAGVVSVCPMSLQAAAG